MIDGEGAYTAVNGERTVMRTGDFIITPHWTWHDHGNDGAQPVVWLDGLDIPTIAFFEAGFAENGDHRSQPVVLPEGSSLARFGANMLPLMPESPFGATSPLFSYPYARSRDALAHLAEHGPLDPLYGAALRYANPLTGGSVIPTIGARLQLLPAGFATRASRTTAGTVYSVVEGQADVSIAAPSPGGRRPRPCVIGSARRITSSFRRGPACRYRPAKTASCSRFPTNRCSRRPASSARNRQSRPEPIRVPATGRFGAHRERT